MKWLLIYLTFFSLACYGDELKVEINPARPVAGEPFQAFFRIFTSSSDEPVINFSNSGLEVIGKSNQGVSTKFVYSNGRITTNTREITVVYDLVAARPGNAYLRDINVQLGNKQLKYNSISLTVLKEPEVLPDVFIMADVPKKSLYLGEGITVRYYLYSKGQVNNIDVKKYPKLNNFLKRFLQESQNSQRVSVDGQVFQRLSIYGVKLFPEKLGELKIDPLQVEATYLTGSSADPFAVFNMNRELKKKNISSEVVKVEVRPLPEPVPSHFTGLIGKHTFELNIPQNRLLVNQPLEVKLTVTGGGALENMDAPAFITHPGLEEFESNGDLKITDAEQAIKTFDYTFLARENLTLPGSNLTLSYFDPDTAKYVPTILPVTEITVAGGDALPKKETKKSSLDKKPNFQNPGLPPNDIAGPVYSAPKHLRSWLPYVNAALATAALLLGLGFVIRGNHLACFRSKGEVPVVFKKGQFDLGEFTRWLSPVIQKTGKSPVLILKESPLDPETKIYFIDLLNANDNKDYAFRKSELNFSYHSVHFKNLSRYIERVKNESSS